MSRYIFRKLTASVSRINIYFQKTNSGCLESEKESEHVAEKVRKNFTGDQGGILISKVLKRYFLHFEGRFNKKSF